MTNPHSPQDDHMPAASDVASAAVSLAGVSKAYPGGITALNGLDLTVARGTVVGLVGRNAAGKSTALRVAMGLVRADHGQALIFGQDYRSASTWERARTAYVSQELRLPEQLTLSELAAIAAPVYPRWDAALVDDLSRRWDLDRHRVVATFSTGQRRRAAILLAMCTRAEVMIMDEPAAGLDPIARRELLDGLVEALGRQDGCSVLMSTHLIGDLDRITDRISIIDKGRLLLDADREALQAGYRRLQLVFPGEVPPLFTLPGMRHTRSGSVVSAVGEVSEPMLDTLRALPGVRLDVFPLSLEDIVVHVVSNAAVATPSSVTEPA